MADTLPPELIQRLVAAWPRLSEPTRALLLWIVEAATAPDSALEERMQEVVAHAAPDRAPAQPGHAQADATLDVLAQAGALPPPDPHAWERIVGAFGAHPDLADWWAAGQALREAERPQE